MRIVHFFTLENFVLSSLIKTQVFELVESLKFQYRDLDFTIVALYPIHNIIRYFPKIQKIKKDFKKKGIKLVILPTLFISQWFHIKWGLLPFFFITNFPFLFLYHFLYKPKIYHCRSYLSTYLALPLKFIFKGTKIIFDMRGLYPEEGLVHKKWTTQSASYKMWKKIEKYLLFKSDKVLVVSDTFKKYIGETYNIRHIENVYLFTEVLGKKTKKKISAITFGYIGSLGSWHNFKFLLDIFLLIYKQLGKQSHFIILSPQYQEIWNYVKEKKMPFNNKNSFFQVVPHSEVSEHLKKIDIGVLPLNHFKTKEENLIGYTMFSTKAVEMLSYKIPLLVNEKIGGLKYLIDEYQVGETFKSDLSNLTKKVKRLVEKMDYYKNKTNQTYETLLKPEILLKKYYKIYNSLGG